MTAAMKLLLSNPALVNRIRPVADWTIACTSTVVPGTRVEAVSAPLRGEWLWAPGARDGAGVVLVLHGSGYLICSARTHRGFASRLSQYSGLPAQGTRPAESGRGR
ncbi:MAG: hypothetical protein ACRDU4_02045 [Mycobacterium sp.]